MLAFICALVVATSERTNAICSRDHRLLLELRAVFWILFRAILFVGLKLQSHFLFFILATSAIKIFVTDEADELLSSGFKEQIHDIFQKMPKDVQAVLLSATMPSEALEITKNFMNDPVLILIKKEEVWLNRRI
jgi:hypothetical protein